MTVIPKKKDDFFHMASLVKLNFRVFRSRRMMRVSRTM